MDKREVIERLDELMTDEDNREAIYTAVGDSNLLGYLEAVDDIGKATVASGCLLLFTAWLCRKFL